MFYLYFLCMLDNFNYGQLRTQTITFISVSSTFRNNSASDSRVHTREVWQRKYGLQNIYRRANKRVRSTRGPRFTGRVHPRLDFTATARWSAIGGACNP